MAAPLRIGIVGGAMVGSCVALFLKQSADLASEILVFERSAHIVPVDHDGPALASAVARFLRGRPPAGAEREGRETTFAESRPGD